MTQNPKRPRHPHQGRGFEEFPALYVNKDANLVVRPPTLQEILAMDLRDVPTTMLSSMMFAIGEEKRRRTAAGKVGSYRVQRGKEGQRMRRVSSDSAALAEADLRSRREFFAALLDADWSELFPSGSDERRFYVYLHYEPSHDSDIALSHAGCTITIRGIPFYVGKGTGSRAYDLKRNEGHGAVLRQLREAGATANDVVQIVSDGLSEREALELESKLFCFFGSRFDAREPGLLINLATPPRPSQRPHLRNFLAKSKQTVALQTTVDV